MIGAIQGNFNGAMPRMGDSTLSDTQKSQVSSLLSDYDAENLTSEAATEIVAGIKELGISPGAGLASAMSEAGFDAHEVGTLAGVGGEGGPPPPPPGEGPGQGASSVDSDLVSLFIDALEGGESEDGENPWSSLFSALEEAGYDPSQPAIDFYA